MVDGDVPFRDPYPLSTEPDSLPRRFAELELPDPYIWLYTQSTFSLSPGSSSVRIAWTTCSTRFPPVGFSPIVSSASPVIPQDAVYSIQYDLAYDLSTATGAALVETWLYRQPYNSVTLQLLNFNQQVQTIGAAAAGISVLSPSHVDVPLVSGDRIVSEAFVQLLGSTIQGGSNSGEFATKLILASFGQPRKGL